jgi:hypothetical protein
MTVVLDVFVFVSGHTLASKRSDIIPFGDKKIITRYISFSTDRNDRYLRNGFVHLKGEVL